MSTYIQSLEDYQVEGLRELLLSDFRLFNKFIFKIQTGMEFLHVDYHDVMFSAVQLLIEHKVRRLVVSLPPRGSKTSIITIALPLYSWARNPNSQSIITGFNSSVLAESSGYIRTIMLDEDWRKVFPNTVIDMNKKSAEKLGTMKGGVLNAVPIRGKLLGLGAGGLMEDFNGLMSIDDSIKPSDCMSEVERAKVNYSYSNTLLSRLATNETPVVIVQQRLHSDDLVGHVLKGETGEEFHWLSVPAIQKKDTGSAEWYANQIEEFGYKGVTPIVYNLNRPDSAFDENGESSFWERRKSLAVLQQMRESDPYSFYTQYQQEPRSMGDAVLSQTDILRYDGQFDMKRIKRCFMTADTASTTKSYSDYSVVCKWGLTKTGELVLLDMMRGKFEVPELVTAVKDFWAKHNVFDPVHPQTTVKALYMEDKSSGQFLNQIFIREGSIPVRPVARDSTGNNDKFSRFLATIPYFQQGKVFIPSDREFTGDTLRELMGMNEYGNDTQHDDIVDNFSDACIIAFASKMIDYSQWYN